jgi:hypothetical protein
MAKRPTAKREPVGGPFLGAAVFCDQVIQEQSDKEGTSGAVSAIRIIDTITVHVPEDLPKDTAPAVHVKGLVTLKAGDTKKKHKLQILVRPPVGKPSKMPEQEVRFKGTGHHGYNLTITLGLQVRSAGLYWFDVMLDGRRLTRMPLMIAIRKVPADPERRESK